MEVKLEVLLSSSIKRKKPWPRFSWLGQEKESVFLLDDKRISEINLVSGRTKKKTPKLQSLLKNVVTMTASKNGAWLVGILGSGELFLWHKDRDCLKTVAAAEDVSQVVTTSMECSVRLCLLVSGDGKRVLLASPTGQTFLWESTENRDLAAVPGPAVIGRWSQIEPVETVILPTTADKENVVHGIFIKEETLGDCCFCSFVFTSEEKLVVTILNLQWYENAERHYSSVPYNVQWVTRKYPLASLVPKCDSVKSRGALVTAFSGDGLLLAIAVNQKDAKASQVLFVSTLNFITISSSLKGCGSKDLSVPSKYVRSYWVGDMSWTPDNLYLACMLKRGSLLFVTRLGDLLTLTTFGCSVEFGPAEFIPLHPLITYRPPQSVLQSHDSQHSVSSCASVNDLMRQRFSVTSHTRLPYLIVSDGYMVTVLRVSSNSSPSAFINSILVDTTQRLEKARHTLLAAQPKERSRLQFMSSLKVSTQQDARCKDSTLATIPRFLLEDEPTGLYGKTADSQRGEDESDDGSPFPSESAVDGGRLEFASMFDTIHAKPDSAADTCDTFAEMGRVQRNLLTAWSVAVSLGRVEQKDLLLRHTIRCFVRFAHLIQFMDCPLPASIKTFGDRALKRAVKKDPWIYRVLRLFKHFLTALYWDMAHSQCFGLTVELTKEVVQLILFPQNDWASSQSLSGCLFVLKLTSRYLNTIYTPRGGFHLLASQQGADNVSDSFAVPFLQDQGHIQKLFAFSLPSSQTVGHNQQPSNRLVEVWKMLYHQTLLYQASLHRQAVQQGSHPADQTLQHEESWTTYLLAQIQAALQAAGQTLGKSRKLNSVAGEHSFLLGSYPGCLQIWRATLQEEMVKDGKRACFLQTRYYLAILYSHLYHYNLSAAQGLCDHLAREVLRRSQLYSDDIETFTVDECHVPETWLIKDVHSEAACAVIQSMARFMAAYFTNQPLYVLPPHNVDILPPLQSKPDALPRVIPLQHSLIASIVRDQHLSAVWTVEYALDLLLIGGLVPEAAWLAHRLGDWKMAVSLSLAYNLYCQSNLNLSGLKWRELHLPSDLHPTQIFQDKLQSLLGRQADPEEPDKSPNTVPKNYKQFTDSIEEEDADLLFSSVQEILKAAVMADADILSETFDLLMQTAKDLTAKLSGLVPDGLYLPAPPLYCPQPALDTEASSVDVALTAELVSRQRVSGVLQRVLLLFRAARCSLPSAQWYIQKLKHSRKIMNKIRLKGSQPQLNSFPDSLLKYASRRGFFKPGPSGDQQSDPVSIRAISTFRELCSLCWMFHVRERLSASCRKYQLARNSARDPEGYVGAVEYDAGVAEHCLDALEWACRLLPFARFMNAEEITQDVILSLVGELPPIRKVAEVLVKVFPEQEDSVRVPLREKYNCLLQRLRHSTVKGPERDEMMSVVIQDLLKQRCKQLKRIARNIGPVEFHIWERAEEGVAENDNPLCDRFSLGTSLSQSTLTDFGRPQVYSDDTADTISEQLQGEDSRDEVEINQRHSKPQSMELMPDKKKVSDKPNRKLKLNAEKVEGHVLDPLALPVVGSWEFECDDDEYVRFLELFLSYMLEKGLVNNQDPGIPFLACFSSHLREHELNSLLFDVHTTLKRRQNQKGSSNIFRAGSCYHLVLGPHPAPLGKPVSVHSETWSAQSSQRPSSSMADPSETNLNANKYFPGAHKGKQKGLFGLRRQPSSPPRQDGSPESMPTPRSVSLYSQSTCDPLCSTPRTPQTEAYIYKALLPKDVDPPVDELTPELQSRFRLTGRLLEWMIRWSDRRLLCGPSKAQRLLEYSTVIRVKASAPAILSSLWMLERRYSAGLLVDKHLHSRVPEREYIVAPVFQQEHRSKVERESSVDTGYPASAETPITLLDQEIFESQHGYDSETASDVDKGHKSRSKDLGPSLNYDLEEVTSDLENKDEEDGMALEEELDLPSVEEDDSGPEDGSEHVSPSISVSIKTVSRPNVAEQEKSQRLTLSDLECPRTFPAREQELEQMVALPQAEGTNAKSGLPNSVSADMAAAETSSPVTGGDPCPAFCVQFHTPDPTPGLSATTVPIETGEPQRRDPNTQPLANSEAVRQMLQDEMFRLVQLQQINFMSLMQVVGSSFMNLPNVQQNLQEAQSNQMNGNQPLNRINERPRQSTGVQHREPVLCNQQQSSLEKHTGSSKNLNADDQSNKENIAQNPPPLILHLDPPQSQPESEGLIPASHGLLTTSPNKHRVQLLVPPSDSHQTPTLIPLEKTSGRAKGLQLLKLQPPDQFKLAAPSVKPFNPLPRGSAQFLPQPREAWAPSSLSSQPENNPRIHPHWKRSGPPSHLNLSQYDPEALRRAEEEKARWAEKVAKGPPRHLNLEQYEGNPAPEAQHWVPSGSPKRRGTGAQPLVPPPPLHTFPCLGLPLLRLQPAVYQLSSACMIPPLQTASQTAPGRPLPTGCAAPVHCPSLQMLQANHPPISKVLPQTLPFRPPKLIPVQELLAFEQSRLKHGFEEAPLRHLQLLKADIEPFERKTVQDSLKRQKRRIEKRQEGKKATVTFRPENSIILPKEKEVTEPSRSQLGEGFVIPPGSFDSVLADQALIAGPIPTSAELHCLASTKKKPADIQDASTNTEPAPSPPLCTDSRTSADIQVLQTCPPVSVLPYRDVETAAPVPVTDTENRPLITALGSASRQIPSRIPPLLPPDVFLNLRFPKESSQEPLPTSSSDPAIEQDISGRCFINVIDIDAGDLLKDLPSSEVASVSTPESRAKLLSNAELHHMAASVTNAVHPDSFQRERETAYTPAIHHETPEKQPLSPAEIREPKPVGDEVTQRLLLDNDYSVQSPSLPGNRSSAKHKFTAKLSEMDVQLTALQNIAENMELEFANTRLLVNTIENLGAVIDPELEPERYTTRGVAVTEEALYLSHAARLEDLMEDDEEDLLSEMVPPSAAASPPVLLGSSLLFAPSTASSIAGLNASSAAVPEVPVSHNTPDFDIMPREAHVSTEDVLDLTGLSDIADILGDLVKDGGISATELGLSEMQARRLPSTGKARGRGPGQAPTRTEKERWEIREWMKRKQQQRLAEYRKQRERSPFKEGTATINLTSKDIKVNNKIKEEKKKMVLSEHNSQRAMEALNLMNEMLSDTVPLPTAELSALADTPLKSVRSQGQRSARGGRPVSRSQSAGHTARSPSNVGQTRSLSYSPGRPSQYTGSVRTGALQKKPSAATGRASSARTSLGLHRPASALPRDRMSQITRRGMLTDLSSWKSKSQTSEKDRQDPRRNGSASHSQGSRMLSSAGPGRPSPYPRARSTRVETEAWPERDVVSPWSPPAEIRRLLEMDVSVQDPLLDEDGSLLRRGDLDGLDCLSESTGSILSKLDWAAIENMLASEEDL
ncbi:ciliogenesis and planar polarity effector 1 isoform X2 [Acipenser ruthenus]|uniref:ciliogenesis and planar polarity effector 1 isoform X2 n=1 Tax=Acipenser ruthenus TaxID=7906 RepID=UPI002741CFB8|nr:ciliogenesis and planar polarity effector 1 isoform X2 [Acipenser ruthenus]